MSDRDKGLQSAEGVLGPNVTRLFCLQHLKRNFQVCVPHPAQPITSRWAVLTHRTCSGFGTRGGIPLPRVPTHRIYSQNASSGIYGNC